MFRAKECFSTKLWKEEGGYFAFDTTAVGADTVMSDQLCGLWYLDLVDAVVRGGGDDDGDAEDEISPFDKAKARRALKTLHDCNVMGTKGGSTGAANGFRSYRRP